MVISSCHPFSILHFVFTTFYRVLAYVFSSVVFYAWSSKLSCCFDCLNNKKKFIQSKSVYFNQCFIPLQFFMDATKPPEEEPLFSPSPDINIEEIGHSIEETLDSADRLTDRLGELNSQMVDWLTNFAINKASTK